MNWFYRTVIHIFDNLNHYNINTKLTSYHEYNATSLRPKIIRALQKGKKIALISDAGTPNISDPGYKLVESCLANDIQVSTIPGPTAVVAALSISGLPTDNFYFGGILPSKTTATLFLCFKTHCCNLTNSICSWE